jgi:hypothetical protein
MISSKNVPIHNNFNFANRSVYFKGTDNKEQWEKNIQNPDLSEHLRNHGWYDEYAITYDFNSHGFRDSEFNNNTSCIALGCSFTEGIGLSLDQTWPKVLERTIDCKVWNLGVAGCSLSTCFRLLEFYKNLLNIVAVFVLEPPEARLEVLNFDQIYTYSPYKNDNDFYKLWVTDPKNSYYHSIKNIMAMKYLCSEKNIKFYSIPFTVLNNHTVLSRDMIHHGPPSHAFAAKLFAEKYYASQ